MVTLSMTQKSAGMKKEITLVFMSTVDRDKKRVLLGQKTQDRGRGG